VFAFSPRMPYWLGFGLALLLVIPAMLLRRDLTSVSQTAVSVAD
jgi:hypothetical protein